MIVKIVLILSCVLLLQTTVVFAQVPQPGWEKYLELADDESDQVQLLEQLEDLQRHPLDLNKASVDKLLVIPGFPEKGALALIEQRQRLGSISSLDAAKTILAVDDDLWEWISQFIIIKKQKKQRDWHGESRIRTALPFEQSRGYNEGKYNGSPIKIYQRYRLYTDSFQFNLLMEKDGGETAINDHQIWSIEKQWIRYHAKLIMGNFRVKFGMGLVLGSPFAIRKGIAPFYAVRSNSQNIQSYLSSYESHYFQGLAFQFDPGKWQVVGWHSNCKQDASRDDFNQITSFYETGYHRTNLEIAKRNAASVHSTGAIVGYHKEGISQLQIAAMRLTFDPDIAASDSDYNIWQFAGDEMQVLGINFTNQFGAMTTFLEAAWQLPRKPVFLTGMLGHWESMKLLLLYRNYSPKYDNMYANGFGEWSNTQNETGWYIAWQFSPMQHAKLILTADQFSTLWRTYNQPLPQRGSDMYIQWEQKINRIFRFYLRYIFEQKTERVSPTNGFENQQELIVPQQKQRIRLHFSLRLPQKLQLSGRIETIRCQTNSMILDELNQKKETGWIFYWDIRSPLAKKGLVYSRFTLFDTDNYDTRLYQFENDLPGVLSNKLLYGRGIRFYMVLRWQFDWFHFSAKYSSTRYQNRDTIGSGLDLIQSPVEHSFSLQMDTEF